MQRKVRTIKKVVAVITDPHPEFVSLVEFPANSTPFRVVKFDAATQAARVQAEELAKRAASAVVDIHSMTFTKKLFKTAEAVAAYMEANGYENYTIEDTPDFFVVPGRAVDDFDGDLETISVTKGLKMTVGRLRSVRKSADSPAAPAVETPVIVADPTVSAKSIYTVSEFANTLSNLAYMLSDLEYEREYEGDSSPVPDKLKAWLQAGAVIFKELAAEEVDELMAWVAKQRSAKAEHSRKEVSGAAPLDVKSTPVAQPGATPTAVISASTAVVIEPVAAVPAGVTVEDSVVTETIPTEVTPVATEKAATVALPAELTLASLAELIGKSVNAVLHPVAKSLTELSEKVTQSDTAIQALQAGVRQVRKSGNIEETAAPSAQAQTQDEAARAKRQADRQVRNLLGI